MSSPTVKKLLGLQEVADSAKTPEARLKELQDVKDPTPAQREEMKKIWSEIKSRKLLPDNRKFKDI
jgi:hypothetical protein